MNRSNVTNSQALVGKPSSLVTAPHSNRQSTLIQSGQGLIDSYANSKHGASEANVNKSNALRASNNSQIGGGSPGKYSYHKSKPAEQTEARGEYVTKEARLIQAQQVKASHFQLGYPREERNDANKLQEEINRQKWNPQAARATKDLARSNFSIGATNQFSGVSQNRNDFQNHGASFDPNAKAKRLELVNELRRSNLPSQNFSFPKTTAQDSFGKGKSEVSDAEAIRLRKEEADKIFAKNRGAKPNFSMGSHKLDYLSENKGSLQKHQFQPYDKAQMEAQVATQRKHNFQMSFEGGSQFEADKGKSGPYKLPANNAHKDRVVAKGSSNIHQVQIGNTRHQPDYKSLTALQQSGHQSDQVSRNGKNSTYTEVRSKIAEQTKDLRSSHFALGDSKTPAQASSAAMYQAPPTQLLLSGANEGKEARERIQKSNFTIKDVHGSRQPAKTQSQANNSIRQGQWDQGEIARAQAILKPSDNINFGQARQYSTEATQSFVGQNVKQVNSEPMRLKEKFTKPNINFGSQAGSDQMMTVAQVKDNALLKSIGNANLNAQNQDQKAKSKEFGSQMRAANFKMGSILPEHNSYKVTALDRNGSASGQIGLNNAGGFKPMINRNGQKPTNNSQQVSSGNNIARGHGNFKTINQEFTNWIQPAATAIAN